MVQSSQKIVKNLKPDWQAFLWLSGSFSLLLLLCIQWGTLFFPFILGLVISYLLSPCTSYLTKHLKSRGIASFLVILVFFTILFFLITGFLPFLKKQAFYLAHKLPHYVQSIYQEVYGMAQQFRSLIPDAMVREARGDLSGYFLNVAQWIGLVLRQVLSGGNFVLNIFSMIFMVPLIVFFLVKDWEVFVDKVLSLLPKSQRSVIIKQMNHMDEAVGGFIKGQGLIALTFALIYTSVFSFVGLDFAILIGVGIGILAFIPYVGALVGFTVSLLVAFYQFDSIWMVLTIPATFMAVQILDSMILTPQFVGRRVGLHPLWMLFALFAGGSLYGFVGAISAIPAAAIIGVLARFGFSLYTQTDFYQLEK